MKIVLVHGFVCNEIADELAKLGVPHHNIYYMEGGYDLTVASDCADVVDDSDSDRAMDIISCLYENEDNIPDMSSDNPDAPIFTGIQETPISLVSDNGVAFEFIGGIWGYTEDGTSRYSE